MFNMQKSTSRRLQFIPKSETLLLGSIAFFIVQFMRMHSHAQPWLARTEAILFFVIPLVVLACLNWSTLSSADARKFVTTKYLLQVGAILFALLPLVTQFLTRRFLIGDANEFVALMMLQNAAWFLVVLAAVGNFGRAGFLLSSALVLFICFTTDKWFILGLALLYALIAMWWLMGNYWSRLEPKLLDVKTRSLPVRWSFLGVSAGLVALVGLFAWSSAPIMQTLSVSGFMPTSGGERWADDYARSGIGDGNMLAAGEDATTTGAVDSDQFIEDDRPSIYDAINELFEDPVPRIEKKRNRAETITDETKHIHDVKRSEQTGKSFRVVRKRGKKRPKRKYEDVITNGLFFVEGPVPIRLKVNTHNHFDGWDWSNRELDWTEFSNPGIKVRQYGSEHWFTIQSQNRSFLLAKRHLRVKIMRLESSTIPSPAFLKSWHIFKVKTRSMFSWGEGGVVAFDGDIPPHTVIDMVGNVPNYHILRSTNNFTNSFTANSNGILDWFDRKIGIVHHMHMSQGSDFQTKRDSGLQLVQVADEQTKLRLRKLADEWTADIKPGWCQIEEIINRFRTDYNFDPGAVADRGTDNAVNDFLDKKSGPSYLFATTATQMLRAAGYKARMATGYLLQEEDYYPEANQSIATMDNLHMWPEVCIDGCHWIPLEPTPGYPVPYGAETIPQLIARKVAEIIGWVGRNPLLSLILLAVFIAGAYFRAKIYAGFHWFIWFLIFNLSASRRLQATRKLIDARFRAAGLPRPRHALVASWFGKVDQSAGQEFFHYWQAANFSEGQVNHRSRSVADACRRLVDELSYPNIEAYVQESRPRKSGFGQIALATISRWLGRRKKPAFNA